MTRSAPDDSALRKAHKVARAAAERLHARYAVEAPEHLQLEKIARHLGVPVVDGRLEGAVARLTRIGDRGCIRVSTSVTNAGRRRFSIAHELGHFVFKHQNGAWLRCLEENLEDFGGVSIQETEANLFAAEFLLPDALVRRRCEVSPVDFRPVIALADDFETSLTATALRFVELACEACAVVFSDAGGIRWYRKSPTFRAWILAIGHSLDPRSVASDFFRKGRLHHAAEEVDAEAWLEEDSAGRTHRLIEHSIAVPSVGAVLSMLWIPEVDDDEDPPEPDLRW